MSTRDPFTLVLVLLLYVLPLGAAVVVLFLAGLPVLAGALLVIEAGVLVAIAIARRPAKTASPARTPRPWLVPVAMLGLLGVMAGATVLVSALD